MHQRLVHRSKISLLAGDTANFCQDIEHRVDTDPFCTSYHISTIDKNPRSKIPLQPKTPFKRIFVDTISSIASTSLTKDTTFDNYILIVDAYSKLPRLYGIKSITSEEVMEKIDMFKARFGKVDESGW